MADEVTPKPVIKQTTFWLGILPLAASAILTVFVKLGYLPPGVPDAVAEAISEILVAIGIPGALYGIRKAVG